MEAFFLNDANQYLEIEVDPHGRYIGLLLDGQRNAVYISGPQFFKVNLNSSGSMVDVTQETRGVMESLPKELELESTLCWNQLQ